TARAVARLVVLGELCLPAAKVGGAFLAYKASAVNDELKLATGAINKLGGQVAGTTKLTLPTKPEAEERNLVVIDKVAKTPGKYPRRPGVPAKKPLINV
ncbi:16S rRNA (guanine(527)-N(7))-methyltransferase RsmG, partial [Limosilactobacillus fermentum]|nr:16S rRNA (guanine(527)-N(7))-methyltransferase RsmG [Limosilactobacillus fermentum]